MKRKSTETLMLSGQNVRALTGLYTVSAPWLMCQLPF